MIVTNQLSNGIRVITEEIDYLRSVSAGIFVLAGSVYETEQNNGISHMLEHMMFKGTNCRTAKDLADDMAKIGGNLNAYTSKEYTCYYVTTLDTHLPLAIDILADMLTNSLFDEKEMGKEKQIILEEIDMYDDSPEDMVHEMLQKEVWKNHPLGYLISGEKDTVLKFTREDLIEFKQQFYTGENIVISIVGHFCEKKVLEQLELCFSSLKRGSRNIQADKPEYHPCVYTARKEMEQLHMNLAFNCIRSNSKEKYILAVANAILGSSDNSMLFQKIREERGLTYSIYSYDSSYEKAGLFHIDAALNPGKIKLVLEEIFSVLNKAKEMLISEEELHTLKEQITTELIIESESTRNRMESYGKTICLHEQLLSVDEIVAELKMVDTFQIQEFFNRYLNKNSCSLSCVGNLPEIYIEKLKKDLPEF